MAQEPHVSPDDLMQYQFDGLTHHDEARGCVDCQDPSRDTAAFLKQISEEGKWVRFTGWVVPKLTMLWVTWFVLKFLQTKIRTWVRIMPKAQIKQ